jgi:hypothetical protein
MSALRPLILLSIILTAGGLAAEQLGPIVGPVEYNGYLVFDYPEGDNPITNIVFNVDPWVSECLIIVNVPAPWTYTYSDPTLTLSGGSLNPGGSVSVTVSLDDYFEEGEYQVTSVGTTSAGEVSNAIGPLLVGDLYLLRAISLANTYQTPLLGSIIGLVALELMFWYRNRPFRSMIPPVKEVNDFVRESEKILNKEGTSKIKVPETKTDPDPGSEHKSVIPELSIDDGSSHTRDDKYSQHSMYPPGEDPSELFRNLTGPGENDIDEPEKKKKSFDDIWNGRKDLKWAPLPPNLVDDALNSGRARTPEEIAEAIGDSLMLKTEKPAIDPLDSSKEPEPQPKTDASEYDDSDLPGLDDIPEPETEYDNSDLPGLDDIPDASEYDNSDLPGLEKPETEPSSSKSDNSDLPGLEKTPETEPTDRAWDSDLPERMDNPPEIEPSPKNDEIDLEELEEIRAREKKLRKLRLKPDEEVKG